MDTTALNHLLTEEEHRQFNEEGYLIVRNAVNENHLDLLEQIVDTIWAEEKYKGLSDDGNLFFPNFVGQHQAFIDLLDNPKVFPKVWGIMGWNIYLYHSHLGVTPQEKPNPEPMKYPLGFHQDSGRVNADIETTSPRPRISLKVAYWLSDVSEEGRGNFYIVPGSHLKEAINKPQDGLPDGAMPVCVNRGDAVFFDRRLFHARSPNHSPIVRKVLFYGYGYRWIRTKDDTTIRPDLFAKCDPIRKQLLGHGTNCNGFFSPKDEDVPLKVWIEENCSAALA
jgi:ectoine hydroxylase